MEDESDEDDRRWKWWKMKMMEDESVCLIMEDWESLFNNGRWEKIESICFIMERIENERNREVGSVGWE